MHSFSAFLCTYMATCIETTKFLPRGKADPFMLHIHLAPQVPHPKLYNPLTELYKNLSTFNELGYIPAHCRIKILKNAEKQPGKHLPNGMPPIRPSSCPRTAPGGKQPAKNGEPSKPSSSVSTVARIILQL